MNRRKKDNRCTAQPDLFALPGTVVKSASVSTAIQAAIAPSEPGAGNSQERSLRKPIPDSSGAVPAASSRIAGGGTPHLLDVRAAAAWLGLSKSTLDKMRCYGVGPRFIRATGRAVRYDPADLAAFAEGRRQSRTTDELPA
jgi:predicted DNA-binding transcriptional regulator AlpA